MIKRSLNILSFIAAFVGFLGTVPVRAAVNMIAVEHRVWGYAGEITSEQNTYDESGPVALSRNAVGSWVHRYGTEFEYASSSASDWSVYAYRDGGASYANAYAQNTYVFKPYSRELSISLSGNIGVWWFENDAQMTLADLSTDSLVDIYQSPSYTYISPFPPGVRDMQDYPINWETTVEVNPEHEYELIIFVGAHRGEGGDGSASLNLTLVPEPGPTMLGSLGLLALLRRRR